MKKIASILVRSALAGCLLCLALGGVRPGRSRAGQLTCGGQSHGRDTNLVPPAQEPRLVRWREYRGFDKLLHRHSL